jgi:hypothetical protein
MYSNLTEIAWFAVRLVTAPKRSRKRDLAPTS